MRGVVAYRVEEVVHVLVTVELPVLGVWVVWRLHELINLLVRDQFARGDVLVIQRVLFLHFLCEERTQDVAIVLGFVIRLVVLDLLLSSVWETLQRGSLRVLTFAEYSSFETLKSDHHHCHIVQ